MTDKMRDLLMSWEVDWGIDLSGPERKDLSERIEQAAQRQGGGEWKQAIDSELVVSLQCTADSYDSPRRALNDLINWNVQVATDPRVNGGYELARQGGEAVAWLCETEDGDMQSATSSYQEMKVYAGCGRKITPLYTAPRPAVPEGEDSPSIWEAQYEGRFLQPDWTPCSERFPTHADEDPGGRVWWHPEHGKYGPRLESAAFVQGAASGHWKPTGLKRPNPPEE